MTGDLGFMLCVMVPSFLAAVCLALIWEHAGRPQRESYEHNHDAGLTIREQAASVLAVMAGVARAGAGRIMQRVRSR